MTNQEAIDIIKTAIAEVEWEYPMDYAAALDMAIKALERQDVVDTNAWEWISVKERLPEAEKHVLASCEIRSLYGGTKHYVCEAFYAPTHTVSAGSYPDDAECYEYDEQEDNYYLLEGWYEYIHNWDDYASVVIGDFVTHWQELPEPPKEEKQE